jgi:Na+/melibiose symporter-like transporter
MSCIQTLSDPARQAVLSRVTRLDTQRAIAVMTVCTSLVGLAGFYLGGYVEGLGLPAVLVLQSAIFAAGLVATLRLPALPVAPLVVQATPRLSDTLLTGLRAVWRHRTIRDLTAFNLLSSLFNAGAYVIVVPFIVKDVYAGDASFFATVLIVFTAGSIGSNVLLLLFMPLLRPARLFLLMQPVRAVLLAVLFFQPPTWLFLIVMFAWGLNIGVATTLVRTTVQELAPPAVRSQILSILLLSFMVASPVSAMLLGQIVEVAGARTALLPGVAVSLFIPLAGILGSTLWGERSPEARAPV